MHVGGPAGTRGAFSLYVPEYYDPARAWPLVVAMHGGSGNGGAFLWSWLREARTRGFIVIAPTARGQTWSMMEPDVDRPNIDQMVEQVGSDWNLDPAHQLLTGMSDGGTFTYVLGLRGDCRFTHLAPVAAVFHPMMMISADAERVRGLPVHIVHGTQDWMFPPEIAQSAERTLKQAGANVVYREIADLSHTYPRDENARILDWFLSAGIPESA
jgi:phospholipase/carboxylesterase